MYFLQTFYIRCGEISGFFGTFKTQRIAKIKKQCCYNKTKVNTHSSKKVAKIWLSKMILISSVRNFLLLNDRQTLIFYESQYIIH